MKWQIDDRPDAGGFTTIRPWNGGLNGDTDAQPIATVYSDEHHHLVAAAPELYEALNEAWDLLPPRPPHDPVLLRSDLEAEAAALHAEARHIERELTCALSDDQLLAATRAPVDPCDNATNALLEARRAMDSISPLGIGRRPA